MDIQEHPDGVVLKIKVQPRASRNKISGVIGDALKVVLTAPPVDGEANDACIDFFSDILGVPKKSIQILSGHTSRTKLIKVYGLTKSDILEKVGEG